MQEYVTATCNILIYVSPSLLPDVFQLIFVFVGKGRTMNCIIGDNKFYRLCAANYSRESEVLSGLNTLA